MDLEEQGNLKRVLDEKGGQDVIVVLGSPDPESARVYAETVTSGDPAWAGPLAGVPLGLPVYHIFEDEIKGEVDAETYRRNVQLAEMALDRAAIVAAVREVRDSPA